MERLRCKRNGTSPPIIGSSRIIRGFSRIGIVLAAGAALATIAPALADPLLSAECLEMDRLRATANTIHELADFFEERLRDANVVAEENKYFARSDAEKTVTLSGTVKKFQWSSPHAQITLSVKNDGQADQAWTIEMNSPSRLARLGWRPLILTPGTPITVMIHPLRDGSNGGQFLTATLPDGRQMDGGRPATNQTRLQTLRDQAAAADRELAEFSQSSGCNR
jgi:hypothetical protein